MTSNYIAQIRAANPDVDFTQVPTVKEMEDWFWEDGGCEATDGCFVEIDGTCPHGKKSWMLVLGLA